MNINTPINSNGNAILLTDNWTQLKDTIVSSSLSNVFDTQNLFSRPIRRTNIEPEGMKNMLLKCILCVYMSTFVCTYMSGVCSDKK